MSNKTHLKDHQTRSIEWADYPEQEDYFAARDFLSLIVPYDYAEKVVQRLSDANVVSFYKAKDILRASRLNLLPHDDPKVLSKIEKINDGEEIFPVLLVRTPNIEPLIIADGWHRVNAVYRMDTEAVIPVQIVDL